MQMGHHLGWKFVAEIQTKEEVVSVPGPVLVKELVWPEEVVEVRAPVEVVEEMVVAAEAAAIL